MVTNGTWATPTTPASSTTHRILTLPLLAYAGTDWEYIRSDPDDQSATEAPR